VALTLDGLITAKQASAFVWVEAHVRIPGQTDHADTAAISIIDGTPPVLASMQWNPGPSDSTTLSMQENLGNMVFGEFSVPRFTLFNLNLYKPRPKIPIVVQDNFGNSVNGLQFEETALDPDIADLGAGRTTVVTTARVNPSGKRPGTARFEIRTAAYGAVLADTLTITYTWPVLQSITVVQGTGKSPRFEPAEIRLAPYGLVFWQSQIGDSVDVTFEDPVNVMAPAFTDVCDGLDNLPDNWGPGSHCVAGNTMIPPIPTAPLGPDGDALFLQGATTKVQQFPVPGIYRYHSVRTGASGQIVVTTNPTGAVP